MLRLGRTAIATFLIAVGSSAQTAEDALQSQLTDIRYSSLAEAARIQGDVHLVLSGGVATVVSGHPLLVPMAVASARAIGSIQGQADIDLTYHFILVDTVRSVPTATIVKRGNAFERAVLRLFGFKTEKVVQGYRCESDVPPANIVKLKGAAVEVWVFGRTHCLETDTSSLVAER